MDSKSELLGQLRIDRSQAQAEFPLRLVIGGGLGLLAMVLIAWLIWVFTRPDAVVVRIDMARVTTMMPGIDSVLDATGYVTARRRATVSSKMTGKVVEVLVEEGMAVEKGQVVARLDDSNLRNELKLSQTQAVAAQTRVEEAKARLVEAELTLQRRQELRQRRLISQSEFDAAQAAFNALQAQVKTREAEWMTSEQNVALQQQRMDDLILRAPFAGVVVAKNAQPGEMISPVSAGGGFTRTGICSLVDMDSLEVEVDVNEAYIDRVKAGQMVQAILDAYPDWKIPAKVIAIIPTADRQKATVKVRIAFDQLDSRILPDMGVKVAFLNSELDQSTQSEQTGILVPLNSVRKVGGDSYIFVVENNIATMRQVKTGMRSSGKLQLISGLKAGESYITELSDELEDGTAVEVQ